MPSPTALNLEAISKAIDRHDERCQFPALEVRMNPFELERLGWSSIRALPIRPDTSLGTGRFKVVCSRDLAGDPLPEATEAVAAPVEREVVEP